MNRATSPLRFELRCAHRGRLAALFLAVVGGLLMAASPAWADDLALNQPASASSTDDDGRGAGRANDGDPGTRWSSAYADNQWWEVDLGADRTIDRVELNWEVAYASRYRIRTRASESSAWSTAAYVSVDSPGLEVHTFEPRSARYVRIRGDERGTQWGISLWDARVCDDNTCGAPAPEPTPTRRRRLRRRRRSPAGAPSLAQVDGGTGYYGLFANGLSTGAGYFPLGVWGAYDFTAANVARDKAVGLNLYVWNADVSASNQQNIAAAGMRTLQNRSDATTNVGAHTAGFVLGDEIDMSQVPSLGLATMQSAENQVRGFAGGRALYANYGKGVLFGWGNGQRISEGDRARYVNDFQELVSSDFYWFTDPWQSNTPADPWLPESRTEADGTISGSQVRRASNYGYQIDEMRRLDALDGQRKPIWAFVEVGSPFTPGRATA